MELREKSFTDINYNFSISKIIDERLNRKAPVANLVSGFSSFKTVGNEFIAEQMYSVFKNVKTFDTLNKIILVINQINFNCLPNDMNFDHIEFSISLDYYKQEYSKCTLLYQQYFKFNTHTKSIALLNKAINVSFSEAIKYALNDFQKKVNSCNSIFVPTELDLYASLDSLKKQHINNQNIKDGIYFSAKDLYINKPSVTNPNLLPDTSEKHLMKLALKFNQCDIDIAYAIVKSKRIFIYIQNNDYKEAYLGEDGKLFFPNVNKISISKGGNGGAAALGIAGTLLPLGFLGGLTFSAAQTKIKNNKTDYVKSDVIIDYNTGNLLYR